MTPLFRHNQRVRYRPDFLARRQIGARQRQIKEPDRAGTVIGNARSEYLVSVRFDGTDSVRRVLVERLEAAA